MKNLDAVALAIQADEPILLLGAPGTAKSSIVAQLAEAMGMHCEVVTTADRDPSDFGFPFVEGGKVKRSTQAFVDRLNARPSILFLDEVTHATNAVQAILMRIVLDRIVGDDKLASHVRVVMAGNPPEYSGAANDLVAPLVNRTVSLPWDIDVSAWVDGMIGGFHAPTFSKLPADWRKTHLDAQVALVTAFIRAQPHKLLVMPKNETDMGKPFPTMRSWTQASRLMAASRAANVSMETEITLVAGVIGNGLALEFLEWRNSLDLPNPADIIANPDAFVLPQRADTAFAVLVGVAQYASERVKGEDKASQHVYLNAWRVFNNVAKQGKKDVAAASVKMLARSGHHHLRNPEIKAKVVPMFAPFAELFKAAGLIN